jgi:ornithine carbamoyltransferase
MPASRKAPRLRRFLAVAETPAEAWRRLLARADAIKRTGRVPRRPGRTIALPFEKPSNRTRVSFEVAAWKMRMKAIYLSPQEIGLGKREAPKDVAAVLGRYVDAIAARVYAHATLETMAAHAGVPVVNALSDREHPCQALGDCLTLLEAARAARRPLEKMRLAYVGDGNNVARSLVGAAAHLGIDIRVASPLRYALPAADRAAGRFTDDPAEAVAGADAVYTDVWASMGDEAEAAERRAAFRPYRVDAALMARAVPGAVFLHCLPAHRGEEVTDEVIDSPASVVYQQAENRLWAQIAVLEALV